MPVSEAHFGIAGFAFPVVVGGACDYPDEDDVREGVEYGDGDYTGTLYVRSDAASGSLLARLIAMVRQLPDKQNVGYQARSTGATSADSYAASVTFEARHEPITSGDFDGMARKWCTWHLYATAGQTVKPARLGKLTDADGLVWHVLDATSGFGGLKFDCTCVLAVS